MARVDKEFPVTPRGTGRADYTKLVEANIIQQTIEKLSVDLVAQTLGNLGVDLASQTIGNIGVDLSAQSIGNLQMDIIAQTIGNLAMNMAAQSIGISLKPEWEAVEGNEKRITAAATVGFGGTTLASYTVPAGKELRITNLTFYTYANAAIDYDHFLYVRALLSRGLAGLVYVGGLGGGSTEFTTPVIFSAGDDARIYVENDANVDCDIGGTIFGFEVDV